MRWSRRLSLAVSTLTGLAVAVCLSGSGAATPARNSGSVASVPSGHCPQHALPLPGIAVARAAQVALRSAPSSYRGLDTRNARVEAADRSAFAGARGGEVRRQCGAAVAHRTVVVQMLFPRMLPSASLSEGVVFVSRFAHGYRVWEVAH